MKLCRDDYAFVGHKRMQNSSLKVKLDSHDQLQMCYTMGTPSLTACVDMEGKNILKGEPSFRFGYGLNFNL